MTLPAIVNGSNPIPPQPWVLKNFEGPEGGSQWAIDSGCLIYSHGALGPTPASASQTLPGLAAYAGETLNVTFTIADSIRAIFRPKFSLGGGESVEPASGDPGTYTVALPVGSANEDLVITNDWAGSAGPYFCLTDISLAS